jgi:hypothetical protein
MATVLPTDRLMEHASDHGPPHATPRHCHCPDVCRHDQLGDLRNPGPPKLGSHTARRYAKGTFAPRSAIDAAASQAGLPVPVLSPGQPEAGTASGITGNAMVPPGPAQAGQPEQCDDFDTGESEPESDLESGALVGASLSLRLPEPGRETPSETDFQLEVEVQLQHRGCASAPAVDVEVHRSDRHGDQSHDDDNALPRKRRRYIVGPGVSV